MRALGPPLQMTVLLVFLQLSHAFQCGANPRPWKGKVGAKAGAATTPSVEPIPEASAVKLTIPVSGVSTREAFKAAARELAKSRTIPGWRAKDFSKIPAGVVASAVGADVVKAKAIEKLSETEVPAAIRSLGVPAVGQAKFLTKPASLVDDFRPGEVFALEVQIDVWPEDVTWSTPYDEPFEITVERTAKDQSVRESAMRALRERYAKAEAVDPQEASLGDSCLVDVEAYDPTGEEKKKLELPQVGGADLEIVLERGKFLPGVVESLVGQKQGAVVEVPLDMPAQLAREPSLAGKQVLLRVVLKSVRRRVVPSAEDVARELDTTLPALERRIDDTVTAAKEQQQRQQGDATQSADGSTMVQTNSEIEKVLALRVDKTPLPPDVVNEAAKQKFAVMLADMRQRGTPDVELKKMVSPEGFDKYRDLVMPVVERELRVKLAVKHIAKDQAIAITQPEIDEQLELVKQQYKDSTIDEQAAVERIIDELTRLKVCDYLRDNVATVHFVQTEDEATTEDYKAPPAVGDKQDDIPIAK